MEYIYAAMLLHKAGKEITEKAVKSVLTAAGVTADEARVKALVAALEGVNIAEAVQKAAVAVLIGLMMGLTILGLFYTWERNVKKQATIFRLPLLLTLVLIGYYLLTFENLIKEAVLLAILWVLFGIFYLYRNNRNLKGFIDKIVECCKKW